MAPYSPTMTAIRYGYGLSPRQAPAERLDDMLAQLSDGASAQSSFPRGGVEDARQRIEDLSTGLAAIRPSQNGGKRDRDGRRELQRQAMQSLQRDSIGRVMQAVSSQNGFYERLSAFWFDHFSVSAGKSLPMRLLTPLYEAEAIRPNLSGDFRDLLQAAVLHPAMLIYLDQNRSAGPDSVAAQRNGKRGLNENLGRELIELHTMGAGSGYSQADVRSAALVLTGMTVDNHYDMLFRSRLAEPGQISVLGVSYGGAKRNVEDCLAMLEDLAARPETAEHICRKLAAHFIADQPPVEVVKAMVDQWKASGGKLSRVYEAMLAHPRAWSDPGIKMKLPFDYVVSGLRALGVNGKNWRERMSPDGDDEVPGENVAPQQDGKGAVGRSISGNMAGGETDMASQPDNTIQPMMGTRVGSKKVAFVRTMTIASLRRMGQPVWQPPSPAGFEEGVATWLSPSQLSERILWARRAASNLGSDIEPRALLQTALADMARDDTMRVVQQAPNRVSGITLVLSSPEFNRR